MQRILYLSLFGLLLLPLLLLVGWLAGSGTALAWNAFLIIYMLLLLINSWYIMVLLIYDDLKPRRITPYNNELISVIVPCYNERPELLAETLHSVFQAHGNKEIILIDDGTIGESRWLISLMEIHPKCKVRVFSHNQGKREALHYAITHLLSPESYAVVTIDSDTILDKNAFIEIVRPLSDPKVSATTGDVMLLNEKQNYLTRMIGTYYWMGLNMYKKAQSSCGIVICCSGCLSAYRTSVIRQIIDDFNSQYFLGEKATHSEDRHLTNLILKRGEKVVYVPEAISYTETPSTLKDFCKQQLRWKRGYVRESIYTLTYGWKNQKRLFLQVGLWDLTSPYLTLALRAYMLLLLFFNPLFVLGVVVPMWIIAVFCRYALVLARAPRKFPGLILYAIFFEMILYWVNLYALFTVKNKRWVTR